MKRMLYSRAACLVLVIAMVLLGVHVENIDMDSSLACGNQASYATGIQRIDSERLISVLCQRKALEQPEELAFVRQAVRSVTGVRIGQWLLFLLFFSSIIQLSALQESSFLLSDACRNQCRMRTLEYIHHKDGKKA
ncbi:MAG: hypothetical protein ACI4AB_13030 [Acetatifactor sp.]